MFFISIFRSAFLLGAVGLLFLSSPAALAATTFDSYAGIYKITEIKSPLTHHRIFVGDIVHLDLRGDLVTLLIRHGDSPTRIFFVEMSEYYEDMGEGRVASSGFTIKNGGPYWYSGSNGGGFSSISTNLVPLADEKFSLRIDPSSAAYQDTTSDLILQKLY